MANATYRPANGAVYLKIWPARGLSAALKDTAQLIKANVGTEVVSIDYGSWDMHSDYGDVDQGAMRAMVGWGNMMLLAGGGVRGGYHGTWPGPGTSKLVQGDLAVTTDYRQVLGEVVQRRFPARSASKVFPGLSYQPLGVMR